MTTRLDRPPSAGPQLPIRRASADRLARVRSHGAFRPLSAAVTVAAWVLAVLSWVGLARSTARGSGLGFDLNITWRAERLFAHGAPPYSIRGFVYPPSALLLFRPLASLGHHQAVLVGLGVTAAATWAVVLVSAVLVGRRWWGLVAALAICLLRYTGAARGELSLENVSVLCALALALFFLWADRGHWTAAGAVLGLSFCLKPLLLVVVLIPIAAHRWRAVAAAVVVPAILNLVGFLVVSDPGRIWSKLPSILNRAGPGVNLNSAWVDVARTLGLPEGVTILIRLVTVVLVLWAAWLAWTTLTGFTLRIVTTASVLLIGSYLAGTLSENHFGLTLVPLALTVVLPRSPMRSVTAIVGMIWSLGNLLPPSSLLSLGADANTSAYRALGMSLVVVSFLVVLVRRRLAERAIPVPDAPLSSLGSLQAGRR